MNLFYNIFVYTVWFFATYYVVVILLYMFLGKNKLFEKKKFAFKQVPMVSMIVPAYNEQGKIRHSIKSLKKINYDKVEFIIVNDGSSDNTSKEVVESIAGDKRFIFIDRKQNKGKAASLNEGIARAKGEFIATMDADSVVEPKIFYKALPYFLDEKVGAVTVSVLVKKPKTFLHKIFEVEFIIGLSLFLKVFSFFNAVFVTPGPFSVYRKKTLDQIGGFDEKNFTEDMEIAYRIHKAHYKIENCMEAKAYTIIPPTFKKICTQRKRWYSGALYTISKHRGMLLNKKYGLFGFFMTFNFSVIFLGLALFFYTTYLGVSHGIENILYFQYTNFNIFEQLKYFRFDILSISRTTVLGMLSIGFTLFTLFVGMKMSRQKISEKKLGVVGYPLMFFLYQFFWFIPISSVLLGRKIKWR